MPFPTIAVVLFAQRAMEKFALRLLLCFGLVLMASPLTGQTSSNPKPRSATQRELNEKLMSTLTWDHGNVGEVRALLRKGASPNSRNWDGDTLTALMVAAQNGNEEIVKLLLEQGAKINVKAAHISGVEAHVLSGITALSLAAFSGNLSIVKMLVEHGADIHALNSRGASVLAYATTNEVVQYFLDRGLDINAHDKDGYTLLIKSAEGFNRPSIAFLLEHGADPNAQTTDGTTALKLASRSHHPADVELLKKAGAKE
jgi:ankyrin repeat protein